MSGRCALTAAAVLLGLASLQGQQPQPRVSPVEIERQVQQLGAEDFEARERAAARLLELEEAALPALREALKSPDAEVRRRAVEVLSQIGSRVEERQVRKLLAEIRTVPLEEHIVPDLQWKALRALADLAARRAGEIAGRPHRVPSLDLTRMEVHREPPGRSVTDACLLLDGESRRTSQLERCLVVANGPLERVAWMRDCVVLVNGDLDGCTKMENCVVVVRGKIGRVTLVRNSVVLATGEIGRAAFLEGSVLEVAGVGECLGSERCVYINLERSPAGQSLEDRCVATRDGPLPLLRVSPR
jgi:hypothetical protein